MSSLQIWREFIEKNDENEEVNIVQIEDGSFWFQASHLCKNLDYKNTQVAISTHCEDYEIRKFDIGQHYEVNFVSESGFYSLVLGSKKPKAKKFKKWVCTDVLPKLRASGGYIMSTATDEQVEALLAEREALKSEIALLENDNLVIRSNFCFKSVVASFIQDNLVYNPNGYLTNGQWLNRFKEWLQANAESYKLPEFQTQAIIGELRYQIQEQEKPSGTIRISKDTAHLGIIDLKCASFRPLQRQVNYTQIC